MEIHLEDPAGERCVTVLRYAAGDVEHAFMHRWAPEATGMPEVGPWTDALRTLVDEARGARARIVRTRVIARSQEGVAARTEARAERVRAILHSLGFRRGEDRVEFRLALDAPSVSPWLKVRTEADPFRWEALEPAGEVTFERAVGMLARVAQGDPMSDPDDDAATFLRESLEDRALTSDPTCVQVGVVDTPRGPEDAAVVIAQVSPSMGWARVTYLGVVPEHRGRGLGGFVHARGLAMLRAQGGALYCGGTSTRNAPMLALFRALGAEEFRAMEEWSLTV